MQSAVKYLATKKRLFLGDNSGSAIIEYALFLPIACLLVLGVMEFGNYFVKNEIANNAISTVVQTIQNDPTYYSNLTASQLTALEKSYGSGMIDFSQAGNNLCVQAFTTAAAAATPNACTSTNLTAKSPNPTGQPYYITVQANLVRGSTITPLDNFVSAIKKIQIAQSSGAIKIGATATPTTCDKPGFFLQYNPSSTPPWQCEPYAQINGQDCSQPWQNITYTAGVGFGCINVPYVFAGGTVQPGQNGFLAGTNGVNEDHSDATWIVPAATANGTWKGGNESMLPYNTYCQSITFNVPANLPAGQILAQGTVMYLGTLDCPWHDRVVSFVHLDTGPTPPTGPSTYSGSAIVCMSSQGNYSNWGTGGGSSNEIIGWTLTFIPN